MRCKIENSIETLQHKILKLGILFKHIIRVSEKYKLIATGTSPWRFSHAEGGGGREKFPLLEGTKSFTVLRGWGKKYGCVIFPFCSPYITILIKLMSQNDMHSFFSKPYFTRKMLRNACGFDGSKICLKTACLLSLKCMSLQKV